MRLPRQSTVLRMRADGTILRNTDTGTGPTPAVSSLSFGKPGLFRESPRRISPHPGIHIKNRTAMLQIIHDADITPLTTFGIHATARELVLFDSTEDLRRYFTDRRPGPLLALGGGSNMLFVNGRYDGTLLHCADRSFAFSDPDADGWVTLRAGAGCELDTLCREAADRGLWGLENLSGIPGTAGGAAVQNVGAYGTELKDCAVAVTCFDTVDMREVIFSADECRYGYRDSIFKHAEPAGRYIVTSVACRLSTQGAPRLGYAALAKLFADTAPDALTPGKLREAVIALRDSKLPAPSVTGSAGSFFKNPVVSASCLHDMRRRMNIDIPGHVTPSGDVKLSAAWLIDHAGCKPLTCGGAALWPSQPLVLVNASGSATGHDVAALEKAVIDRVRATFGVELSPEVVHVY